MYIDFDKEDMKLLSMDASSLEDYRKVVLPDGKPIDLYKVIAAKHFGVDYMDVTPEQRHAVKCASYFLRYDYGGKFHV